MPKRVVYHLKPVENPNPQYASVDECLRMNIPLLVRMIRGGEEIERRQAEEQTQPITPTPVRGEMQPT